MTPEPSASSSSTERRAWAAPGGRRAGWMSSERMPTTTLRPSIALSAAYRCTQVRRRGSDAAAEPDGELAVRRRGARREEVHRRRADEAGDEEVRRLVVEPLRRVDLLEHAHAHHGDAVAHRHRLDLVVRDVDRRRPELVLELRDLARIWTRSFASRFDSGSSMRKTCGSRTIARPIATRWRWPPESCFGLRSRYGVRSSSFAAQATRSSTSGFGVLRRRRPKAMLSRHGQVRVERVVLEDHRDVAVLRRSGR